MALFFSYIFSPARKLPGWWLLQRVILSQQRTTKAANCTQGCVSRSAGREASLPFCQNTSWGFVWLFKRHQDTGACLANSLLDGWGPECVTGEEQPRERSCLVWRKGSGHLLSSTPQGEHMQKVLHTSSRRCAMMAQGATDRLQWDKFQLDIKKGEEWISLWRQPNTGSEARQGDGSSVFNSTRFRWAQPWSTLRSWPCFGQKTRPAPAEVSSSIKHPMILKHSSMENKNKPQICSSLDWRTVVSYYLGMLMLSVPHATTWWCIGHPCILSSCQQFGWSKVRFLKLLFPKRLLQLDTPASVIS